MHRCIHSFNNSLKGSVHKVLSPPSHPYTDLLISSVPELRVGWLEDADKNIQTAKTLLEKQDII